MVDDDSRTYEQKLVAALNHPLSETRARICWVLGQKKVVGAVPHLLHILVDPDLFVRVAALQALGENGDERALPALERFAADESVLIQAAAQEAVKQIRIRKPV
jgi:HEAT repeat protein